MEIHGCEAFLMSETGFRGIDLFKIAGESISGWIPSWKIGGQKPTRQPFCRLMEERLLLYLEYHPKVAWYGRGDISPTFASTYKITTPLPTPFTINYLFEGNAHVYLPDAIGQHQGGSLLIAEAGLEREKRRERNQAKAEAARKVVEQQGGVYWIGTEATLLPQRHANLVFLHARRQPFPSFQGLAEALQVVWPWGEAACVQEVVERLGERWSPAEKEAAVEAVLAGATVRDAAAAAGMGRSTLGRLVQRTRQFGQIACVPRATYSRERKLHPAFQQTIRLLYSRPTKLSMRAIAEHVELKHVASRLQQDIGMAIALPSYDQVRKYIQTVKQEPKIPQARV